MASFTRVQRNAIYRREAARAGIHKPILAALDQVQQEPTLADGETGLGISPANRISLSQVNTLANQVKYAANTLRSLIHQLIDTGWKAADLWDTARGRYTDKFIAAIAKGYTASTRDSTAAILESSDANALAQAYQADLTTDSRASQIPADLTYLDQAVLTFGAQLSRHYIALPFQRQALLEGVRIWLRLDDRQAALTTLEAQRPVNTVLTTTGAALDPTLLRFVSGMVSNYSGYPHQREALLRLTQLWWQLDSREAAIAKLQNHTSPEIDPRFLDAALLAFVQRLPSSYQAQGEQRNALVEGFLHWQQLTSRSAALVALGVDPEIFAAADPPQHDLEEAAIQLDRALLDFFRSLPAVYEPTDRHREALLHLVQLWRRTATRDQTIQSLIADLNRMQAANRDSPEAPPLPTAVMSLPCPERWTPANLQIHAAIIPHGSFTWAEATHGGTNLPTQQIVVDSIVRMAQQIQQIRDRLGRPLQITTWYEPVEPNSKANSLPGSRHPLGDAIDLYSPGLTGEQLYCFLDPWWPGGLGRYRKFPSLIYVDASSDRVRWMG